MADRNTVKQWFLTGKYPTQAQFHAWLDSILFSGEVQIGDIANLSVVLQQKVEKSDYDSYVKGLLINAAGNVTYQQLADTLIEKVVVIPSADADIRIGTSNGGEELLIETRVSVAEPSTQTLILNAFSSAARDVYINGVPAGSKVIILPRPIKTL